MLANIAFNSASFHWQVMINSNFWVFPLSKAKLARQHQQWLNASITWGTWPLTESTTTLEWRLHSHSVWHLRKKYVWMFESLPFASQERRTVEELMFDKKAGGVPGQASIDRISSLKDKTMRLLEYVHTDGWQVSEDLEWRNLCKSLRSVEP